MRLEWDYDLQLQFAAQNAKEELEEIIEAAGLSMAAGLSKEQMRVVLEKFGIATEKEVELVLERVDANGDGVVDIAEFDILITDLRRACHGRGEDPSDSASWCPHAL